MRDARSLTSDGGRYIDYGVRLYTVIADEGGDAVLAGRPDVRVARIREPEDFGGIWDTRLMRWHDQSANPVVWYASEEQRRIIVHGPELPDRILCRGAEGAGKTRGVVAPWALLRAIEFAGQHVELGGTAPTMRRLETLRLALFERAPHDWYTWRQRDCLMRMPLGVDLRLVSTHRASEAEGSPVQGFDWAASFPDELQDQLHAVDDILARGRRAPGGRYRQCASASVKDTSAYRTFEEKWKANPLCAVVPLIGPSNPFVSPKHWENLRTSLDDRSYRRRVLAESVGPERAIYPSWSRTDNVRPVPRIGARDVTARVLGGYHALVGHDPGQLQDVSIILKCYEVRGQRQWWVVDEVWTEHTTTEEHVSVLGQRLRTEWQLQRPGEDEPQVLVRCDPQGDSDNKTDRSIYTVFRLAGFRILSAAYTAKGQPTGRVPKDPAIDMVRGLLCARSGDRRLFVACDERRDPCAPHLVQAFEEAERDVLGRAEVKVKGVADLSHAPAALRYALWPYERPREFEGIRESEGIV